MTTTTFEYDIVIVGAGIAGCAMAKALSNLQPQPKVALLERSLAVPSRIVGELLQPTGVQSLEKLGMRGTLDGIEAALVRGYYVWDGERRSGVRIPYTGTNEGRSFHHGRFVDSLRKEAGKAGGVDMLECTVSELVYEQGRVVGVVGKVGVEKKPVMYRAALTIVADGCFSLFRAQLLAPQLQTKSHFVGTILKGANLPVKYHGTVCLVPKGNGPVLLYQIHDSEHLSETRLLVDVKAPLPRDLKSHIKTNIVPYLPEALHEPILSSLESPDPEYRIRTMPNTFLPPAPQSNAVPPGVFLLGDAYNMRHPLTGGGMSVALHDVVVLQDLFLSSPPRSWASDASMKDILTKWYWRRKPLGSTINILSVALYDLFGADDRNLAILRNGCFKYFERGGKCVDDPVELLSGVTPSPRLLFHHFFSVAFYSILVLFTRSNPPTLYGCAQGPERRASIIEYPSLLVRSIIVFLTAVKVFGPLLWTEVRWWNPWPSVRHGETSTSRGEKSHDEKYSEDASTKYMALFAVLASAVIYYWQVAVPAAGVGASQPSELWGYTMSALKSNVNEGLGILLGSTAER